jgi:crotonobetainyl-CoA:carnitine CoA-transferase CaiB-like acyl-CoA transferase
VTSSNANAPRLALERLLHGVGLANDLLDRAILTGADPVMPSSFAIGAAAQSSVAAAALAASMIELYRGGAARSVSVDMQEAILECTGFFSLDGQSPESWDPIAGLYRCGSTRAHSPNENGYARLHTNFAHHRDGVLKILGLDSRSSVSRQAVAAALQSWDAQAFERIASQAGMVVAAARSFEEWDAHPQANFIASKPLIQIEKIGEADPLPWPKLSQSARPLQGLRVLDLTRIIAGPVGGRTLANYGADVMLVNSPNLPNIASIADTSRGKRSAHIDLSKAQGVTDLRRLLNDAHIFIQGYRPGALARLGFDPLNVAAQRPGIVCVSLSAYGDEGPWGDKRGFDSLVQTATGFNVAEAQAASESEPRAMPVQILDYATGFLLAFGAQAALYRQVTQGGSWLVKVSLARTGLWLRSLGRLQDGFTVAKPDIAPFTQASDSGFGRLIAVRHAAKFSGPESFDRNRLPSMPPGSHPPQW